MRSVTISCASCRTDVPLEQAKEAMFETGNNEYHLVDLCARCLDDQLQASESTNDTQGYRQTAAVLLKLPDGAQIPGRAGAASSQ
jgi:hypothetical protein